MNLILIVIILVLGLPMFLRGGGLHNHLVRETGQVFRGAGFGTFEEHPVRLPDGSLDFLDLLVRRGNCTICIEIETSARNVLTNATKADLAGLPLWIVVPNRKVQKAVADKLDPADLRPGGLRIYLPLLGQLEQALTNYFPKIPSANDLWENRKTNPLR